MSILVKVLYESEAGDKIYQQLKQHYGKSVATTAAKSAALAGVGRLIGTCIQRAKKKGTPLTKKEILQTVGTSALKAGVSSAISKAVNVALFNRGVKRAAEGKKSEADKAGIIGGLTGAATYAGNSLIPNKTSKNSESDKKNNKKISKYIIPPLVGTASSALGYYSGRSAYNDGYQQAKQLRDGS